MTNLNFLPKDLTPAQRAGLKLASHFVLIALFNALLAGYVWLSDGNTFSWHALFIVAGAQAALALLDAAKKFVTAQGDLPFSALIELARLQLAQHSAPVAYTPAQQALQQDISNVFAPNLPPVAPVMPTPAQPLVHPLAVPAVASAPAPAQPADPSAEDTAPRPVVSPAQS